MGGAIVTELIATLIVAVRSDSLCDVRTGESRETRQTGKEISAAFLCGSTVKEKAFRNDARQRRFEWNPDCRRGPRPRSSFYRRSRAVNPSAFRWGKET